MENKNLFEQAISSIVAKIDSSEKFILDQAPEVCRQLLAERAITERMDLGLYFTLFVVISIVAAKLLFGLSNAPEHSSTDFFLAHILGGGISALIALLSFVAFYSTLQNLISLKVAPKVYLLRELGKIVKGNSDEE